MRVTEVNLIPRKGYLIEVQSICVDHHSSPVLELSNPETLPVSEGKHYSTIPPLTHGCVCWAASVQSGIVCIVTMAGHSVIEVSEVKRVSGAKVHPQTVESGYQHLRCCAVYVPG